MKRILLLTLFSFSLSAWAQQQITVESSLQPMSKGTQPCFVVTVPQAILKDVEKDWLKYTAADSKGKASQLEAEHLRSGAVNTNISPQPFNVYSKLLETSEGVRLTVWITENDSLFISKELNNDQYLAVQKYVRDFALLQYQQAVENELATEQNKQKELEKELDGLIKDEEKAGKKVSDNQRSIQRSNDNIATNNADIQTVSYKINDQKGMIERTASDPNANKGAKQTMKELEAEKKKLQKQNENEAKSIDSMNKSIREQERNIADLKEQGNLKRTQIEQQKKKVQEVQSKLENIK